MRVVSIAQNAPGPVAVAKLVKRGIEAIKIEPPSGDPLATFCRSWYDELHAGVQVERLDLKSAAGQAAIRAHLNACALFLASQRPSALARLGLDAASLAAGFPSLRHLNIVGDAENPERPGHDLTYQAEFGLINAALPLTLVADMVGGDRAFAAAIEMLHGPGGAARTIGLADAMRDLAAPLRHGLTAPGGLLGGGNPAYNVYRSRDGMVAVAALEPHFRVRLYESLGLPDGADLARAFETKTALEWEQWALERDLPLAAVRTAPL